MTKSEKVQLNVRLTKETVAKLDEIVQYYQSNMKIGKVYKGDVLTDIIDKYYDVMKKQQQNKKPYLF